MKRNSDDEGRDTDASLFNSPNKRHNRQSDDGELSHQVHHKHNQQDLPDSMEVDNHHPETRGYDDDEEEEEEDIYQDADELELLKANSSSQKSTFSHRSQNRARHPKRTDIETQEEDLEATLETSEDPQEDQEILYRRAEHFLQHASTGLWMATPSSDRRKNILEPIQTALERELKQLAEHSDGGVQACVDWLQNGRSSSRDDQKDAESSSQVDSKLLSEATIHGDPREYQRILLQMAKHRNTIIHMGTGYGKTLIALLLIKHTREQEDLPEITEARSKRKQTLFLVPSVALAIQQSWTLRANLPFKVVTACLEIHCQLKSRQELLQAEIIVATHGAMKDLLMHYQDAFQLQNFNLLVMDECHYCAGNHDYHLIMRKFFHPLPPIQRPHILGLTASPLIGLKNKHTDVEIEQMLTDLETIMNATLVSAEALISKEHRKQEAVEHVVEFRASHRGKALPSANNLPLLKSRIREFKQLEQLYHDLGPLIVSLYCQVLTRELSRNVFEQETPFQFETAMQHLKSLIQFCEQECHIDSQHWQGRTDKLWALEQILESEMEYPQPSERRQLAVGLVFVQRRITAVALHYYFQWREQQILEQHRKHESAKPLLSYRGRTAQMRDHAKILPILQANAPLLPSAAVGTAKAMGDEDLDDQFADASDEASFPGLQVQSTSMAIEKESQPSESSLQKQRTSKQNDQFMDVEESSSSSEAEDIARDEEPLEATEKKQQRHPIRSATLVRNITDIFNSLSQARARDVNSQNDSCSEAKRSEPWLHVDLKIRPVLSKLRQRKLNLLFATSLVEEGVDVQACNMVIAFDSIRSTKSYIQMKGRARQQHAKFFVLEERGSGKTSFTLDSARELEQRVHTSVEAKTQRQPVVEEAFETCLPENTAALASEPELQALKHGSFKADHGVVDLQSAKSLLFRYSLSVPIEAHVRTSREALMAHMPHFRMNYLILPSHLPMTIRVVHLPKEYHNLRKREKEKVLSLMACVRLYVHGLFNHRLLPLTKDDICKKLHDAATELPPVQTYQPPIELSPGFDGSGSCQINVRRVRQESKSFSDLERLLNGHGHSLGLISLEHEQVDEEISFSVPHREFGCVSVSIDCSYSVSCNEEQYKILQDFFVILLNERWRRRSSTVLFRLREAAEYNAAIAPILMGLLSENGDLDWGLMEEIVYEYKRPILERQEAVRCLSRTRPLPIPRVWTSSKARDYTSYIVYGLAGETASADFPVEKDGVRTYQDYFKIHRGMAIDGDDQLVDAQRFWTLPSSFTLPSSSEEVSKESAEGTTSEKNEHFRELRSVKIPQSLLMEAPIANTHVALLSCFSPLILFYYERIKKIEAMVQFCNEQLPKLGKCLSELPYEKIATAMTARRSGMDVSYEKLEWFGDAVLKMFQTQSILGSAELKDWVNTLHEGDLAKLREEMGSNKTLSKVCRHFGIDQFIMSDSLARAKWLPVALVYSELPCRQAIDDSQDKIYADVIESLLGLIYLEFGFEAALDVGNELSLTLSQQDLVAICDVGTTDFTRKKKMLIFVQKTTGYVDFKNPRLLIEAFAHRSAENMLTSSYERLEWIGDAVLCLTTRSWILNHFPDLDVGELVSMESVMVSNEVFAFLSVQAGLHKFLDHQDRTLPPRIESYIRIIRDEKSGLWGTDPPKCLADIVESLIGAIYVDGGLASGMAAAQAILSPICHVLMKWKLDGRRINLKHPKKSLQELVGSLLVVGSTWEDSDSGKEGKEVLEDLSWGAADPYSSNSVAHVDFMNHVLVTVSDPSVAVARNKVCAILTELLRSNPVLLQTLSDLNRRAERAISNDSK